MKDWKKEINEQLKLAIKNKDTTRLNVLKLLKTELTNEEVKNEREELTEGQVIQVIQRAVKKRKEAIEEFRKVGQEERANEEEAELKILMEFLPEQLSREEIEKIVDEIIKETGAETMKDMGKVMSAVMPKVKGRADGKIVSEIVRNKLSK